MWQYLLSNRSHYKQVDNFFKIDINYIMTVCWHCFQQHFLIPIISNTVISPFKGEPVGAPPPKTKAKSTNAGEVAVDLWKVGLM